MAGSVRHISNLIDSLCQLNVRIQVLHINSKRRHQTKMTRFFQFIISTLLIAMFFISLSSIVFAQAKVNIQGGPLGELEVLKTPPEGSELNEDHSGAATWIRKWYGLDGNYENNGGFNASGPIDLIAVGTNQRLSQEELSTVNGLQKTQRFDMEWAPNNGGTRKWTVFELNPADANNMNRGGAGDNFDTYGIIVIRAPVTMKTVMSPAHDDYAQIWINGEKWYNNPRWTGAPQQVDYNIEVELKKGANVLLYRVGEGSGAAYMNLHFNAKTHRAIKIYPFNSDDQKSFFNEIHRFLNVEAGSKLTTTWADIKKNTWNAK